MRLLNDTVRVSVTDGGPGFRYTARTPAAGQAGGWGLVIISRAATRSGTSDEGRTVWFELDLGTDDRGADERLTGGSHEALAS